MLLTFALVIPFLLYIIIPIKKKYRYFGALFVTIFYVLIFLPSLRQGHLLARHGVQQTGVLTSKNCDINSKPHIEYRFVVDHKEISGAGRPGQGNQHCDNFKIGDQVFVTYLPDDVTTNVAERNVESHVFGATFGFFALYLCLLWLGNEQEKFKKKKVTHPNS